MTSNDPSATSERLVLTFSQLQLQEALRAAGFTPVPWPDDEAARLRLLELAPRIEAVVAIGPKPLPEGFMEAATRLGLIACVGAGYENYDPVALKARGVRLTNAGGVNAEDVADLAIGLYIAAQRRIVEADGWVKAGRWGQPVMSHRIRGRRLGVVGLGAIGEAVAVRGAAMGMEVAWWGPRPKPSAWTRLDDPMALAQWADVLAVCCRPTPENEGLVGAAMLDALGPSGVLVNVSRGSLVNEPDLIAALREGRIAAAALDVFAEEPTDHRQWADVPNLTLHPHSGGATYESIADGRKLVVENVRRHYAGEPLLSAVN